MTEDVDEKQARFRLQPFRYFLKKLLVVLHVLEHFVGDNTIKLVIQLRYVDISGNALNYVIFKLNLFLSP